MHRIHWITGIFEGDARGRNCAGCLAIVLEVAKQPFSFVLEDLSVDLLVLGEEQVAIRTTCPA